MMMMMMMMMMMVMMMMRRMRMMMTFDVSNIFPSSFKCFSNAAAGVSTLPGLLDDVGLLVDSLLVGGLGLLVVRLHGSGWLLLLLLPELLDLLLGGLGLVRLVGLGLARPDHLPHAANLLGGGMASLEIYLDICHGYCR